MSRSRWFGSVTAVALLLSVPNVQAWNATGHQVMARIAWDHMSPAARNRAIAVLRAAPEDACLLDMFPEDARPLDVRQRDFFVGASTWSDIVRPRDEDTRPCTRFHNAGWHFINYFWEGISGGSGQDNPEDRHDLPISDMNIVERLTLLRPFVVCATDACGTTAEERAMMLAWMIHLVGDVHQPLHTSARVTPTEREGDRGGNLFRLDGSANPLTLHSFWDGIVDRSIPRKQNERESVYIDRVAARITANHPRTRFDASRLKAGDFKEWSKEGLALAKRSTYPRTLRRGQMPADAYRADAFRTSEEAIALAAYRLADLLERMFKS